MARFALLVCLTAGCCCLDPREPEEGTAPPLPPSERLGGRFDQSMERLLGPDRTFDPDIRPPFAMSPDPRMPGAPRAEDPSWKNR
jgi:hypothetical protein